jgi:hypothetical protein
MQIVVHVAAGLAAIAWLAAQPGLATQPARRGRDRIRRSSRPGWRAPGRGR